MKHDWLKGKCRAGKVAVYSVKTADAEVHRRDMNEMVGPAYGGGRVFLMTKRKFATELLARDQEAWPVIQHEADHIEAILECRRCHNRHVLVYTPESGIEALTGHRVGRVGAGNISPVHFEGLSPPHRFDVEQDGRWFRFRAPMMMEREGTSYLECQKCGELGTPKVRLT